MSDVFQKKLNDDVTMMVIVLVFVIPTARFI